MLKQKCNVTSFNRFIFCRDCETRLSERKLHFEYKKSIAVQRLDEFIKSSEMILK